MENLLLHICCGPCATPIIPVIKSDLDISGFYYNPNIYPEAEFTDRLDSAKKVVESSSVDLFVSTQDRNDFFDYIGETKTKPDRCLLCYKQRLTKTAEHAKKNGFSYFSTTLLISPFQYHEELKNVGEEVSNDYGVHFYYQDFRPLYKESRKISKEMDLYLQKYCGCKFSRKRK